MKRTTKQIALAAAVATAAVFGGQAYAQYQGGQPGYGYGPMMGGPMMHNQMMGGPMMGAGPFNPAQLEAVHRQLALTPAQEPAWAAYVGRLQEAYDNMADTHANMDFQALQALSPQERYEVMSGMHEARVEDFAAVAQARDALIATLNPQQRAIASRSLPAAGGGPGMMGGPMMGNRGMMGGPMMGGYGPSGN